MPRQALPIDPYLDAIVRGVLSVAIGAPAAIGVLASHQRCAASRAAIPTS